MMDNKSSNSSEYTLSEEKDNENPKPSGYTPPKEKRRRTALDSISKITDPEVRGEVKGIVNMLLVELDQKEDDASELLKKLQKTDDEKALLKDEFKKVESPMYYRSAIEMLEIFYIPDTDKRESMSRLQRWEYILKLPEQSVAVLRDAIKERGRGITLENFPRLIRDAYKDCNSPIHEYFRRKFGLHSSMKVYFQSHNLHFGMGLTKRAVEVLVDCITKFESPMKTPQSTNEPTSGISKTPKKTLQSTNEPTSGISKNLFGRRDFDRGFKRPRSELSDQNSNVPWKRYRNSEHDSERYFPRFPYQNYSYSEQYRNSERYPPPPYQHNSYSKQYRNSERYPPPSYQHYNFK